MKQSIKERIHALRMAFHPNNIKAFIIPSTDPHLSEYVAPYWMSREWISGFTGSAGTVVVLMDKAGLWTDSRYFLQAEKELEGSGTLAALTAEIDAALADGRLPKACEGWAKATAKTNPEAIRSYIASAVPVAALTDEDRYACKQLGLSEADFIAAKAREGK